MLEKVVEVERIVADLCRKVAPVSSIIQKEIMLVSRVCYVNRAPTEFRNIQGP